jgi:hypothetical protein
VWVSKVPFIRAIAAAKNLDLYLSQAKPALVWGSFLTSPNRHVLTTEPQRSCHVTATPIDTAGGPGKMGYRDQMKLPAPDELTDEDRALVANIVREADRLADCIMASDTPDADSGRALQGGVNFGNGSRLFTPSQHHLSALERLNASRGAV